MFSWCSGIVFSRVEILCLFSRKADCHRLDLESKHNFRVENSTWNVGTDVNESESLHQVRPTLQFPQVFQHNNILSGKLRQRWNMNSSNMYFLLAIINHDHRYLPCSSCWFTGGAQIEHTHNHVFAPKNHSWSLFRRKPQVVMVST